MKLLSLDQVAEILPFTVRSLRQMCLDGRLPAKHFGKKWLINEDSLNEMFSPTIERSINEC